MLAGSAVFVREQHKHVSCGAAGVEAQHIPTQPVREEPQGMVGEGVRIPGFPSVNHTIFSVSIES